MRFLSKFYSIILVIVISALFMMMFFIVDSIRMMDNNENLLYVPSNTVFAAKINTSSLLKLTANELISTKDKELLDQMEDLDFQSGDNPFNGINFASNIYFFIVPFEHEYVEGFVFNLSDKEIFQEYYFKEGKYAAYATKEVGVLLLKDLNSVNSIEAKKLSQLAENILESPQNSALKIDFSDDDAVISTWSTNPTEKLPFSNNLELSFDSNKILLDGNMSVHGSDKAEFIYLERNGISMATGLIPTDVNDSLNRFLGSIGVNNEVQIKSFSANYSGVNFEQAEALTINPQIELLINLDKPLNWTELENKLELQKFIRKTDSSKYIFSEVAFSVLQPEENQLLIYTGIKPSERENRNELFEFSGDPSLIFKVGGNSPYGQFLNFIPLFRSGRILTNATEVVEIKVVPLGHDQYKVNGVIQFKPGYSPIIELIRFLNSSALLK